MSIWNNLSWVESIRNPVLSIFFENISLAGYPTFLILFISFGYFYWSPSRFSRVAMLLFISAFINAFLKDFFQDPRPDIQLMLDPKVGTSYGWPSGHAQIAVTLWGLLAYELKNKWITIGALTLIALIAFSRMYLGVHDLGDVFSGLVIGSFILLIWHYAIIYKFYEKFNELTWLFIILSFQLLIYLIYPTHEGHEISIWFLGVMSGWYIGSSQIILANSQIMKLLLSLISLVGVFFAMVFTTQLESSLELIGIISILFSYSLGLFFSIFVTWVIPRFWKMFSL
ncbi:MAG: phosphatase PAP2 family protein [Gammaproteobacteria bacterium]|nr:MAG: phosphatase PAP2 family protein [Gammaproteobacteria bacterium]